MPESGCLHCEAAGFSPHWLEQSWGTAPPPSPVPSLGANEAAICVGLWAAERIRGSSTGGLNEDRKTMTFPLEGCIIPRPCKAPQEERFTPCPGRLGTAQTRETEAQPGAETPEDPNPPSEPPGCWRPHMPCQGRHGALHAPSHSPLPANHRQHPGVPTTGSGHLLGAAPGIARPGHRSIAGTALPAPACTPLPAAKPQTLPAWKKTTSG